MAGDLLLVDSVERHAQRRQLADGIHDIGAPAVIERHRESQLLVEACQLDGRSDLRFEMLRDALQAAKVADLDLLLVEVARLTIDEIAEDAHQSVDLARGARPIFGGERVDRQITNALIGTLARDPADILGAGAVSGQAWQAAPLGPAPVAIHDDRDMARDSRWRSLLRRHLIPQESGVRSQESGVSVRHVSDF